MRLVNHIDSGTNSTSVHFSLTDSGHKTCMCDCRDCCGTFKECTCKECDCTVTNVHDPEGYTPQHLRKSKIERPCKDCGQEIYRRYNRGRWPIRCAECR